MSNNKLTSTDYMHKLSSLIQQIPENKLFQVVNNLPQEEFNRLGKVIKESNDFRCIGVATEAENAQKNQT